MKHRTVILFALCAVLSLACLAEAGSIPLERALVTSSPVSAIPPVATGAPVKSVVIATKKPGVSCVRVTASKALTLRAAAGVDSSPVSWLLAGDIVYLVGTPTGDWWPVEIDGRVGYARSSYLKRVDCP